MSEGIPLENLIHKKCGNRELVKYGGGDVTIYCEYCIRTTGKKEIVEMEDVLAEEEFLKFQRKARCFE